MNRHERRTREAQQRQAERAFKWKSGLPGEVHIGGGYSAASIEQMGGTDKIVTICFRCGPASFRSALPIDKIDDVMTLMEGAAAQARARKSDPRQEAMSWVLSQVKRNKHLTPEVGPLVAINVFWLAATSHMGEMVLERAKQGDAIVSYDVTEGDAGYGNNWRLGIDGLPGDADHLPVPKHPMPGHPGGPALNS